MNKLISSEKEILCVTSASFAQGFYRGREWEIIVRLLRDAAINDG